MIRKLKNTPYFAIVCTQSQFLVQILVQVMLVAAVPSACAGNMMTLSSRCAALKPATTLPPNEVTTLIIAAEPAEITAICKPDGIPRFNINRISRQADIVGRVKGANLLRFR